ncbi:hypothetical protein LTR56_021388 [Elasticomyces elasticus]|nr:hypothetical protein LTR56_021388 [Elasticomyces elasticus]KAK3625176.1 hypothetical protein LTR22_023677 [Elasticomyces elasticus]KAK4920998.1 hypothetical protein LTR49_011542 [Elasticomyces elasticus]KAK5759497.1 hypothetical protein LTS12_010355 [Elasticomyces elasticus]
MSTPSPKRRTFTYKKIDRLEIPLDLYLPDDAKNVPILLWFHGGGLLQGKRTSASPHMLKAVSKYNIALVSADYRLAPQIGVAEIYEDVKDCVAFIRNKLSGLAGDGAIDPKVILPIYPITDPLGLYFTTSQPPSFGGPPPDVKALERFIDPSSDVVAFNEPDSKRNGMYTYMLQEANLASLLKMNSGDDTWRVAKKIYERGLPPTYVVHGDADTAVGVDQADEVVGVMVGLGLPVVYERLHGVEHLFDKKEGVTLEKMYEWMMKQL